MIQRVIIIGAGVVGLHVALLFKEKGWDVYVLDKEAYPGHHTSTRNSGVIHAGIYYASGTLKEKFCLEGNQLSYEWLAKLGVDHQRCGKWVIPGIHQKKSDLESFYLKIQDLVKCEWLDANELKQREPALKKTDAVFVASTGIVDAAGYVRALARLAENQGVSILYNCEVSGEQGQEIFTSRGAIEVDRVINTAGLWSAHVAKLSGLIDFEIRPCRGDYYQYGSLPISKPVYHPPNPSGLGLGIHLTPTLDGQLLLGPNAYYIQEPNNYDHGSQPDDYLATLKDHLPDLPHDRIQPAYSGNRPKLFFKDKAVTDFCFVQEGRWIHALGIESPGLTAAPAIARHIWTLMP